MSEATFEDLVGDAMQLLWNASPSRRDENRAVVAGVWEVAQPRRRTGVLHAVLPGRQGRAVAPRAARTPVPPRSAMSRAQDRAGRLPGGQTWCAGARLHVPAILPKSLDSDTSAGYRRRLAGARTNGAAVAHLTTAYPSSAATGAWPLWSASPRRVTRSRCDYGRLPSAKLFEAFGGDEPARALALSADLLLAEEPPNGLHVPACPLRSLCGGVADARDGVGGVRHAQIISNYRYLQRKIVVTNDCFMGY